MAGMYPDNRTESIFGELVEWPGVDPVTGKFTNGDFSDPFKKPSFVPAETVNLILDNLANLITALGGTPDNFSVNRLRDAVGGGLNRISEHTFVVDSNAALAAWADNTAGNDYSRVLIKAGTWTLNVTPAENGQTVAIDVSDGRTISVVGEMGSGITVNRIGTANNGFTFIRGGGAQMRVEGISVTTGNFRMTFFDSCTNLVRCRCGTGIGVGANSGIGFVDCTNLASCIYSGRGGGFVSCENLTDCAVSGGNPSFGFTSCINLIRCAGRGSFSDANGFVDCANLTDCIGVGIVGSIHNNDSVRGNGFVNCTNLTNCTGSGHGSTVDGIPRGIISGNGFVNCTGLTHCTGSGGTGIFIFPASFLSNNGFANCTNLIGCTGIGGTGSIDAGSGNGFSRCRTGFGNRGAGGMDTGLAFDRCNMAQGSTLPSTNDWANTAEGGWNGSFDPGASSLSAALDVPPDAEDAFSGDTETSEQDVKSENINADTPCPEKEAPANGRGEP